MIGRLLSIARKELLHIFRDPRTLVIMFLIMMLTLAAARFKKRLA